MKVSPKLGVIDSKQGSDRGFLAEDYEDDEGQGQGRLLRFFLAAV